VYQQGIGNNEPVLTIRGIRGLETAQTLDDVPIQDLLSGGTGGYLQNIIGGHFNLDQIGGVSIYPGVAYPDKNTFGTIGGTVAYQSKRPENDFAIDVFGSVGSFGTENEGFTLNSGNLDGVLGSGDNAPKMLLQYSNLQTKGFVDYTPARYNNMEFAFDKPYDDGLSKFQATVLYNTGSALYTPEPVPLPYLAKYGRFSNVYQRLSHRGCYRVLPQLRFDPGFLRKQSCFWTERRRRFVYGRRCRSVPAGAGRIWSRRRRGLVWSRWRLLQPVCLSV
jgi:iron complex outermembrane receptor protein